jgi:hypothetical protein
VQNSSFTGSRDAHFQYNATGSGAGDLVFGNNTLRNSHPNSLGGHLLVTGGGAAFTGTLTYSVTNNNAQGAKVTAMVISKPSGTGTLRGTVSGNTIGDPGLASSGSANGLGILALIAEGGTHTTAILNNSLYQWRDGGIKLQAGGVAAGTRNGALNATVTGNTVANYNGTSAAAVSLIYVNAGTNSGDAYSVCVNLNTNAVPTTGFNGGSSYDMWSRFGIQTRLPGYTGALNSSADMKTYLTPRTTNAGGNFTVGVLTGGGGGFVNTPGGAACPTP